MSDTPVVLVIDPTGADRLVVEELAHRYAGPYDILHAPDSAAGRELLQRLAVEERSVALVLADRASGELLGLGRTLHPLARRAVLVGWNEQRRHREEIAAAFAQRQVESVVTRPIGVPDERFHRSITELLDEWWRIHGAPTVGVWVVGEADSPRLHELADFLQRHDVSSQLHTVGTPEADRLLAQAGATGEVLPVIGLADGTVLVDPTNLEFADAFGARTRPGDGVYDVVVVGGGPAGLSAAVYAQSEGLRTAVIEPTAMGGQAGTSSMIRNFLGFPHGISGAELAARAFEQAILFGAEMVYGNAAVGLRREGDLRIVTLADGTEVPGRSVVIATGVSYRTLDVPELVAFGGRGVFYGAAMTEASRLAGQDVVVVGGGNSAGQAALHLARFAHRVTMLVRGESLARSMSEYLITEIGATENIAVRLGHQVVRGAGASRLERVDVRDETTGEVTTLPAAGLFVLIGAAPFTDWLPPEVVRDEWGYVCTGPGPGADGRRPFETTMSGVFAVGDVRRKSVKRVASAVGEGAVCIRLVHDHLSSLRTPVAVS